MTGSRIAVVALCPAIPQYQRTSVRLFTENRNDLSKLDTLRKLVTEIREELYKIRTHVEQPKNTEEH